jgi:hypothetical protein
MNILLTDLLEGLDGAYFVEGNGGQEDNVSLADEGAAVLLEDGHRLHVVIRQQ